MSPIRRIVRLLFISAVACFTFGCDSSSETAAAGPPRRKSTRASPPRESLADYYNTIATVLPPRLPELVPLIHVENEFQRKKLELLREMAASPVLRTGS